MLETAAEYRRGDSRRDLRRRAWELIGAIAEPAASVRERADGDTVTFVVVTGIPENGHFATHGHTFRLTLRPASPPNAAG
ncbi:MAG: hypothetical protein J2P27_05520 [Actinobacteria bacterium]|nr:hypothetical protein [Actinomycetota bacterium]MBO0823303.1 hypothetical protein [Actinomycetota bacterium]